MSLCLALLLATVGVADSLAVADLGCAHADGRHVDWYVQMKRPWSFNYTFVTSKDAADRWRTNATFNVSRNGPTFQTLTLALQKRPELFLAYNDEPAEEESARSAAAGGRKSRIDPDGESGHMKGVLAFKGGSGFWLIHSVPKYPKVVGKAVHFPDGGRWYGQSFICVSFNSTRQLDSIAKQLFVSQPDIYRFNVTQALLSNSTWLQKLKSKVRLPADALNSTIEIRSSAGLSFRHVAKSRNQRSDIYDSLVAPQLRSELRVQTWQHGVVLNSNCSVKFPVIRIKVLNFDPLANWKASRDHSKWCVTDKEAASVCIGDMNRATSQFRRGGGLLCLRHPRLHALFSRAAADIANCPLMSVNEFVWLAVIVLAAVATCAVVVATCAWWTARRSARAYQTI